MGKHIGTFDQKMVLVEALSMITNLRVDLCFKLYWVAGYTHHQLHPAAE